MRSLYEFGRDFFEKLRLNHIKVENGDPDGDVYLDNLYAFFTAVVEIRIKKNEKDVVIGVTGPKGEGKSNASIYGTCVFSYLLNVMDASLEKNIIYHYQLSDATKRIVSSRMTPYVIDEAVDAAFNQDAITRVTKFFAKVFFKGRKLCNIYFLNMPKMFMFASTFKSDIIQFRIEIIKKFETYALASLHAPDKNPNNPDPWFMEENRKNANKANKATTYHQVMTILKKDPTFVCFLKIPKIPEPLNNAYKEGSFASLEAMVDEASRIERAPL